MAEQKQEATTVPAELHELVERQESDGSLTKVRSNEIDQDVELESSLLKPVIRSGSIGRYWAKPTALALFPYKQDNGFRLIPEAVMGSRFPKA